MIRHVQDWRTDLVEAHPRLFQALTGKLETARGWPTCEAGWHDLLEKTCTRIEATLVKGGSFRVLQIKEKFGTLRFYWDGPLSPEASAQVDEAIALAEARSACTCELCGAEGQLYQDGATLMTRCADHRQGRVVEKRAGFDNIHIVHQIVDGRLRVVKCRRYDRETDSFIDIDPTSLEE